MLSRWLSEPVPALGGITPIEASKTPQGRKRLKELLEEFENRNARVPAGQQGMVVMDVDELRKRLGMEEELPPPLSWRANAVEAINYT